MRTASSIPTLASRPEGRRGVQKTLIGGISRPGGIHRAVAFLSRTAMPSGGAGPNRKSFSRSASGSVETVKWKTSSGSRAPSALKKDTEQKHSRLCLNHSSCQERGRGGLYRRKRAFINQDWIRQNRCIEGMMSSNQAMDKSTHAMYKATYTLCPIGPFVFYLFPFSSDNPLEMS